MIASEEQIWTEDQVASLRGYQSCGMYHPFTSQRGIDLIPTREGWRETADGPVVQKWAHGFMLNWLWKHPDDCECLMCVVRMAKRR